MVVVLKANFDEKASLMLFSDKYVCLSAWGKMMSHVLGCVFPHLVLQIPPPLFNCFLVSRFNKEQRFQERFILSANVFILCDVWVGVQPIAHIISISQCVCGCMCVCVFVW